MEHWPCIAKSWEIFKYENPTVIIFVSKSYKYWYISIFFGWVALYLQIDCHVHSYVSDQRFAPSGLHLISDWMQLENSCLILITSTLGISFYFWPSVIYWLTAMLTLTYHRSMPWEPDLISDWMQVENICLILITSTLGISFVFDRALSIDWQPCSL